MPGENGAGTTDTPGTSQYNYQKRTKYPTFQFENGGPVQVYANISDTEPMYVANTDIVVAVNYQQHQLTVMPDNYFTVEANSTTNNDDVEHVPFRQHNPRPPLPGDHHAFDQSTMSKSGATSKAPGWGVYGGGNLPPHILPPPRVEPPLITGATNNNPPVAAIADTAAPTLGMGAIPGVPFIASVNVPPPYAAGSINVHEPPPRVTNVGMGNTAPLGRPSKQPRPTSTKEPP